MSVVDENQKTGIDHAKKEAVQMIYLVEIPDLRNGSVQASLMVMQKEETEADTPHDVAPANMRRA